jgi:putative copper export protein
VIAPTWETLRLFLHVLAATVWVGGQLTLAALVPVLRRHDAAVPKVAARAFDRVAWPAFGVLLLTGLWNVAAEQEDATSGWQATLALKLVLVAGAGGSAWAHVHAKSPREVALYGALSGLTSVAAVFVGLLLTTA